MARGNPVEQRENRIQAEKIKSELKRYGCSLKSEPDTSVSEEEVKSKNLSMGSSNKVLEILKDRLPVKIGENSLEVANRSYKGEDLGMVMLVPNPFNEERFFIIGLAFEPSLLRGLPMLFYNPTDYVVYNSQSIGGPDKPVLEEGFFLKLSPDKWEPFHSTSSQ